MIFTLLITYNHDMTSNKRQPVEGDIGLPVLRKSMSEPRLLKDIDDRFERQHHRHAVSATPRIVTTNGLSPRRQATVLNPHRESQPPKDGHSAVAADRSIDMINPRNFPVVMTKNFLRRRANTADIHGQEETTNANRQNGGSSVGTNGKYGSPGSGSEVSDRHRGSVKRGEQGSSRTRSHQFVEGKTKNGVALPDVSSWRKNDGIRVLAALPGNKSDLRGGRSSAFSSCSWQTYPLSSRPFSNRGSKYLRGDQRTVPTNGFIPQSNNGYPVNTNSRLRTRFTTPGQREHVPPLSSNEDTSDPNNATQLPANADTSVLIGKPTTELLQRKRATTANDLQQKNAASKIVDELVETVVDEDENRNFRVRDWLSSLDSTMCQRYARRQMASLREYELSNHKS